ncbi:uncharacterized protein LOC131937110 [Physella acuta]|uniref:uncharacterized protein LOC131937110 n=1 Tax=Physella acuta TaxID=109671 RepID=UPI0027DDBCFB|nr:uncharacterized protein LOC131937110 [Physella acuta]
MYEYYKVKASISACGKLVQGQDGQVEDIHLYLKNVRGTAAYWQTALNELIGQIRCLGPPTYFVTLSCNDLHWLDMRKALLVADGRPDENPNNLTTYETQRLIEQFPVVVSRHFMIRLNALMKFVKNNQEVFGGHLKDYWWRIEFQNRGSPHLHMLVWIENHPSFDTPEGIAILDQICKCEIPLESSDLYELVKKCQIHRHTNTCKKGDNPSLVCRFRFPRPVQAATAMIAETSDEFIRNGGRICLLKRGQDDIWVNSYNPTLLKIWGANMDIQPCGSNESIAYYIAKYIAKSEPTELALAIRQAIQEIQREDSDVSRKLFKICMRIMNERQVSACECVYRLCHLNVRDSSRKCIFLNTRQPQQRYIVLKFHESGQSTGYCANIFDRYEKRPLEHADYNFNQMCLIEFAMLFEPYYAKQQDAMTLNIDEDAYETEQRTKRRLITLIDGSKMTIRKLPAVVRVPYFVASTDGENYFYSLLLQYTPYRREEELLNAFATAREAFLANEENLKITNAHMELYRERDKQLENAFNQFYALQILEEATPAHLEDDYVEEAHDIPVDEEKFSSAQKAMNVDQRHLFRKVTESVIKQLDGGSERLKLFITGGAGVGKTFILSLLRVQINRCFAKNAVIVSALTGVAARLIGGSTLHSTLKLPVQRDGRSANMCPLTGNYLRVMRTQWKNVECIIIDEISMVSYQMLCMIDMRIRQLKNNYDEFFGGINVLLFGDLMQLPPIRQGVNTPVYKQPDYLQPSTHLWRLFSLCELSQNMRQQGDDTFRNMLNALRVGEMSAEHFATLTDKLIENKPTGDFGIDKALRIYPTNEQVNTHNEIVLQYFRSINTDIIRIKAQDQLIDATRNTDNVDIHTLFPTDINKTGGLPRTIEIFVGAKVMLRSNIDVSKGLVNGAIGYITDIIWPHFRRAQIYDTDIPSVRIDFGKDGVHEVKPKSVQFSAKYNYGTAERRMLPLILSWASTVHKMQGCTVDHAVVYLGPKLFEAGQAYVALSRVRSLDGLRIEELDCRKLTGKTPCNNEALSELNRLKNTLSQLKL